MTGPSDLEMGDAWVAKNSLIPPLKMHALGTIVLKWNVAEYWTNAIFCGVVGVSEQDAAALTYDMSTASIWDRIKYFARKRQLGESADGHIEHASVMFDRCRLNRNRFVHSIRVWTSTGPGLARPIKKTLDREPIQDDLDTLRGVADDIGSLVRYLSDVAVLVDDPEHAPSPQKPSLPTLIGIPPRRPHPGP